VLATMRIDIRIVAELPASELRVWRQSYDVRAGTTMATRRRMRLPLLYELVARRVAVGLRAGPRRLSMAMRTSRSSTTAGASPLSYWVTDWSKVKVLKIM